MRSGKAIVYAPLLASLIAITMPATARADEGRIHVVLVDGSEVQGELVEKVPGDHLTLQLATGEIRTIPWASIQSTNVVAPTPPLPTPAPPPPSPTLSSGFGAFGSKDDIAWPKPDRRPSPFAGDHFYVGLASGVGTPVGYGGVVGAWDPVPYFELEAGVGLGGRFGYAFAGMARLELPLMKWMRMGIGLGFSENFLSASDRAPGGPYANAPKVSRWLNFEFVDQSFAIGTSGFLRISSGFAFVLNRSAYDAVCPASSKDTLSPTYDADCGFNRSLPITPKRLASDGRPPFVPYFGLEFLWRLS